MSPLPAARVSSRPNGIEPSEITQQGGVDPVHPDPLSVRHELVEGRHFPSGAWPKKTTGLRQAQAERVWRVSLDASAPILLFDSGVGGLTVLAELRKLLPEAPVIYAADTGRAALWREDRGRDRRAGCRAARADGRALSSAADQHRLQHRRARSRSAWCAKCCDVPIVGTVPAIKPAAALTQTGMIGLLGTEATIRQKLCRRARGRVRARQAPAAPRLPGAGRRRPRPSCAAKRPTRRCSPHAAAGLRGQPGGEAIDTVVLACTHFPLVEEELAAAIGPERRASSTARTASPGGLPRSPTDRNFSVNLRILRW